MRLDAVMESEWTLKHEGLEVSVMGGHHAYAGSRFEHAAQVRQITYRGKHTVLGTEKLTFDPAYGFGLHNEFDILQPAQYAQTRPGEGFHKIGVGVLQRTDASPYFFATPYRIAKALDWTVQQPCAASLCFHALSPENRGQQYHYRKALSLQDNDLQIDYCLENRGSEPFATVHYCHNFLCLNHTPAGRDYELSVDGSIDPSTFGEHVDPDACLRLDPHAVRWGATPRSDFFIEHLVQRPPHPRGWTLTHLPTGLRVSEWVDFAPSHFNLWGQGHVISPELFHAIHLPPGASARWQRSFRLELA